MTKTRRANAVVMGCIAVIMGAIFFFAIHSAEFNALASGPKAKYSAGDQVECYGQEYEVEEVLDWYALPSYLIIDRQGDKAIVPCYVIDGTEPPGPRDMND